MYSGFMNNLNKSKIKKKEKGQVLLFVVVAMTVALALGVGVSLETLSTISNVADTDTAQRALAASEGGAEHMLAKPANKLETAAALFSSDLSSACAAVDTTAKDGGCLVSFEAGGVDTIASEAIVSISEYNISAVTGGLEFTILQDNVKEINLEGYGGNYVDVCWNENVDMYYLIYGADGDYVKRLVDKGNTGWAFNEPDSPSAPSHGSYSYCFRVEASQIDSVSNVQGLRIRPLGGDATVEIFPEADLPIQGYRIESSGKISTSDEVVIKRVVVFRSLSYLPGFLDFSLFSTGTIE